MLRSAVLQNFSIEVTPVVFPSSVQEALCIYQDCSEEELFDIASAVVSLL